MAATQETYDYIETPGRAVALALMAELVANGIDVNASREDDGGWAFKVPTREGNFARQLLAKVTA